MHRLPQSVKRVTQAVQRRVGNIYDPATGCHEIVLLATADMALEDPLLV